MAKVLDFTYRVSYSYGDSLTLLVFSLKLWSMLAETGLFSCYRNKGGRRYLEVVEILDVSDIEFICFKVKVVRNLRSVVVELSKVVAHF